MSAALAGAAETFGRMNVEQRLTLLRLYETRAPWRVGSADEFPDHAQRRSLCDLGLVAAVFPESKAGGSGRQFWMLNGDGYRVLGYCLEWRDRMQPVDAVAAGVRG